MTGPDYLAALRTLNLTPEQAALWLGVAKSTAYRYGTHGPHPGAARAIRMRLALEGVEKWGSPDARACPDGDYVRHADVIAAIGD